MHLFGAHIRADSDIAHQLERYSIWHHPGAKYYI